MNDVIASHDRLRPLMFSIAYRMLGSVADAEDVVQEAFLRMHKKPVAMDSVEAYAATVTTRLAIDHLRSARFQREKYVGTWLPEPLIAPDTAMLPAERAEAAETLSMAFLVVLETLSPVERAVFLLREVFAYNYDDIAAIAGKSATTCRQILTRAKAHLRQRLPRFETSPARREALAEQFFTACQDGDLAGLEAVLAQDAQFHADGGGKAKAVLRPVLGRFQVARFLLGLMRQASTSGLLQTKARVNGQPGWHIFDESGKIVAVMALHIADHHVQALYNVMNPDKLRHLATESSQR